MPEDSNYYIQRAAGERFYVNPVELVKINTILPSRGLLDRYQDQKLPWNRVQKEGSENLAKSKRNYKVYEDFCVHQMEMSRNSTVLDTGAVPNFFHAAKPPAEVFNRKIGIYLKISDENEHLFKHSVLVVIYIRLNSIVCERLTAK